MAEEIGTSTKLGHLLPLDRTKDAGHKPSEREASLQRRKRRPEETGSEEGDSVKELDERVKESSAGKIVDIVI